MAQHFWEVGVGERKHFLSGMLVLTSLALALGACRQTPGTPESAPLNFDTDPRILRGIWSGEDQGHTLRLQVGAGPPYEGATGLRAPFNSVRRHPSPSQVASLYP